jgi:hypothetical protein
MEYLVEKFIMSGFAYHYLNTFETWDVKISDSSEQRAKDIAKKLSEDENAKYRVRSFYSGNILFTIDCRSAN